jgi:hypothetical protein
MQGGCVGRLDWHPAGSEKHAKIEEIAAVSGEGQSCRAALGGQHLEKGFKML